MENLPNVADPIITEVELDQGVGKGKSLKRCYPAENKRRCYYHILLLAWTCLTLTIVSQFKDKVSFPLELFAMWIAHLAPYSSQGTF